MKNLKPKKQQKTDNLKLSDGLSASKTKLTLSEKEIENSILEWLNHQANCKAWKNQSVGVFDPYKRVFRKPNGKYRAKGTSDILGIWAGRMLCIEVKSAKGRLSEDQNQFLHEMADLGAICIVARSLSCVVNVFDALTNSPSNGLSGLS